MVFLRFFSYFYCDMKKLILLLFIPLVSFGQNQKTYVSSVSVDENELALSEQSSNIKTPLNADLSNYTHLLLVKVDLLEGFYSSGDYNKIESILNLTAFEIMNPCEKYKIRDKAVTKTINIINE